MKRACARGLFDVLDLVTCGFEGLANETDREGDTTVDSALRASPIAPFNLSPFSALTPTLASPATLSFPALTSRTPLFGSSLFPLEAAIALFDPSFSSPPVAPSHASYSVCDSSE